MTENRVPARRAVPAPLEQVLVEAQQCLKLLAVMKRPKNPVLGRVCQAVVDLSAERHALAKTLTAVVAQWMEEARDMDADGDYCCGQTRLNDAEQLQAALAAASQET